MLDVVFCRPECAFAKPSAKLLCSRCASRSCACSLCTSSSVDSHLDFHCSVLAVALAMAISASRRTLVISAIAVLRMCSMSALFASIVSALRIALPSISAKRLPSSSSSVSARSHSDSAFLARDSALARNPDSRLRASAALRASSPCDDSRTFARAFVSCSSAFRSPHRDDASAAADSADSILFLALRSNSSYASMVACSFFASAVRSASTSANFVASFARSRSSSASLPSVLRIFPEISSASFSAASRKLTASRIRCASAAEAAAASTSRCAHAERALSSSAAARLKASSFFSA